MDLAKLSRSPETAAFNCSLNPLFYCFVECIRDCLFSEIPFAILIQSEIVPNALQD